MKSEFYFNSAAAVVVVNCAKTNLYASQLIINRSIVILIHTRMQRHLMVKLSGVKHI